MHSCTAPLKVNVGFRRLHLDVRSKLLSGSVPVCTWLMLRCSRHSNSEGKLNLKIQAGFVYSRFQQAVTGWS